MGDTKYNFIETIAHELAHQWFGNLVTMKWWNQLWLNEGFATYVSHLIVEALDPTQHTWERFHADEKVYVMLEDATSASWAISNPVASNDDINRKFGSISYYKGAALIYMMESFLGYNTLIQGLRSYLRDLSFMNAEEEDLFTYLEAAGLMSGSWPQQGVEDLTYTMKQWTQQEGFPLVSVQKKYAEQQNGSWNKPNLV